MATRSERLNKRADALAAKGKTAKAGTKRLKAQYGSGGALAASQQADMERFQKFQEDPSQFGLSQQQTQDQIAAATQGAAAAAQQQQAALAAQSLAAPGGFQAGYLTSASQGLGTGSQDAARRAAGDSQTTSQQMISQLEGRALAGLDRVTQRKREAEDRVFDVANQAIDTGANAFAAATGGAKALGDASKALVEGGMKGFG